MKPYQRVASRYMEAKYENLKGNITIELTSHRFVVRGANLGVELKLDGEYMGHCEAIVSDYTLAQIYMEFACADDIEKLSEEYWFEDQMVSYNDDDEPVIHVVEIVSSELDKSLRGQKCGIQMYIQLVREAFLQHRKMPLLFIPNYCHDRSTSNEALRVWKSLAKKYHSQGDVIVIDKTPYL